MKLDLSVHHGRDLQEGDMFRVGPDQIRGNTSDYTRDDGYVYGIAMSTTPDCDNEIRATLVGDNTTGRSYVGVDGLEVVLPNDEVV